MGFEIFLECQRFVLIRKSAIPDQFPGSEFSGVGGFAGVVVRNPPLQIGGCAGIFLFWKIHAADDVDVPHRSSSPSSPKRATPGTTLRPSAIVRLRHAKPEGRSVVEPGGIEPPTSCMP